jgi:hypothetical protein
VPLVDGRSLQPDGEPTEQGGNITSVVTAYPLPPAGVLGLGAFAWMLVASGFVPGGGLWATLVVLTDLVAVAMVLLSRGPARLAARIAGTVQLVAAATLLAQKGSLVPALLLAHALSCLTMLTGQAGDLRRTATFATAMVTGLAAVASVFLVSGAIPAERRLRHGELGFTLVLPPGFTFQPTAAVLPHLSVPPSAGGAGNGAFRRREQRLLGMVFAEQVQDAQLIARCQALHRHLGGQNLPKPLGHPAPAALGTSALVYELTTGTGARGLFGCGRAPGGRLVTLAVVEAAGDQALAEAAFDEVGAGLSLQ